MQEMRRADPMLLFQKKQPGAATTPENKKALSSLIVT